MTLTSVRAQLAQYGVAIRHDADGEYRVNLRNGTEATAYYTNDLEDALCTGIAMGGGVGGAEDETL